MLENAENFITEYEEAKKVFTEKMQAEIKKFLNSFSTNAPKLKQFGGYNILPISTMERNVYSE